MTKKEKVAGEIHVAFDFLRYVMESPGVLDEIPDGGVLDLVSADRDAPPVPEGMPVARFLARRAFAR
ncbi:MAG: hypothetical protein FJ125_14385 [Deltaproteobacteria bacterium]|nr:hypothetical protein [Deltaproteobacteria bacterium]